MKSRKQKKKSVSKPIPLFSLKLIILTLVAGLILFVPGQNIYTTSEISDSHLDTLTPLPNIVPAPIPVNFTGYEPISELTTGSVIVRDLKSGIYLLKYHDQMPMSPASITKILTALIAIESYDLGEVVTVTNPVLEGQTMDLVPGEKITVENLLYGTLIQSGNDAAFALADHYPGGREKFVAAMNAKARQLQMNSSHFENPVGFDDPNHKMTAQDLVKLATYALQNPILAKMVAIPEITISDISHTYFHRLVNVNELLGKIPGVGGIKTGWTEEAGENLVTLVDRNDHKILIVVLHSVNRFLDTEILINWVFGNFKWQKVEFN